MAIWQPTQPVENNRTLALNRGNPATWGYTLGQGQQFPASTTANLTLTNSYGQTIGTWEGYTTEGAIIFDETSAVADAIPAGTAWQLYIDTDGISRLHAQGTVIRSEAPYPDAPPQSSEYDGVRYQYAFGTPGFLYDPAWRILVGQPRVYNNSARSLPNACASGSLTGGDFVLFGKSAMLYFAPLQTDAVRLTYNTIRNNANSNGTLITIINSNYDATNWAGFRHRQVFGIGTWNPDTIDIVVGSGPLTYVTKATFTGDTANNTYYTGEYNPLTNTYTIWRGTTQIKQWTDSTNIVNHGPGERYVGFAFEGDIINSGVQVSDWLIGDAP